eukprot:CAMPEP_0171334376 /NCGR_PEP_ID=MMETSP0878-20121228/4614_1 /TAXON_ID=67004 /ORGANISM="Thalassiosira weissflogii, Strain CCMP1336" /LENGTH=74 /DNA_ID=CAMNT_0011835449 /DNA_START=47 /DNA_END=271 /DNA_ORIENTATION=-
MTQQQQQDEDEKQTIHQQIQELEVVKSELTSGDTSGLVYVQPSTGAAFFVTPRGNAIEGVERKINELNRSQGGR